MATLVVYADTADGELRCNSTVYADARSGAGSFTSSTTGITARVGQNLFGGDYRVYELFFGFDASAIGDTDTINDADLDFWGTSDLSDTDFTIEARASDWGGSLTSADWVAGADLGALTLLADLSTASFSTGAYNTLTPSGANLTSWVSLTGVSYLLLCSDRTGANTAPTGNEQVLVNTANANGTTNDPKLTVDYTPSSTPATVNAVAATATAAAVAPASVGVSVSVEATTATVTATATAPSVTAAATVAGAVAAATAEAPVPVATVTVTVQAVAATATATAISGAAIGGGYTVAGATATASAEALAPSAANAVGAATATASAEALAPAASGGVGVSATTATATATALVPSVWDGTLSYTRLLRPAVARRERTLGGSARHENRPPAAARLDSPPPAGSGRTSATPPAGSARLEGPPRTGSGT